jgi:hypothetical protein
MSSAMNSNLSLEHYTFCLTMRRLCGNLMRQRTTFDVAARSPAGRTSDFSNRHRPELGCVKMRVYQFSFTRRFDACRSRPEQRAGLFARNFS